MNVYVIVWESYGYMDDEYGTTVEIFETLDSAKIYFEVIKSNIIRDYFEHAEVSDIDKLIDDDCCYIDEEPTRDGSEYFFIDYDEFGHDRLRIYEKPIMKFNLEEC